MWVRFTLAAKNLIFRAQEAARNSNESEVDVRHLLLAAITDVDAHSAQILTKLGVDIEGLRLKLEQEPVDGDLPDGNSMRLSKRSKRVIDLTYDEAREQQVDYIGTEHIVLALIRDDEGAATKLLAEFNIHLENARAEANNYKKQPQQLIPPRPLTFDMILTAGVGLVLEIVGISLLQFSGFVFSLGVILLLISIYVFLDVCSRYGRAKGYNHNSGYFGLLSIVGLAILAALPDKTKNGNFKQDQSGTVWPPPPTDP